MVQVRLSLVALLMLHAGLVGGEVSCTADQNKVLDGDTGKVMYCTVDYQKACSPLKEQTCLPGAQYIGRGWDVTVDSLEPSQLGTLTKDNLFELNMGNHFEYEDQGIFTFPDVGRVNLLSTSKATSESSVFKTSSSYANSLMTNAGLTLGLPTGSVKLAEVGAKVGKTDTTARTITKGTKLARQDLEKGKYSITYTSTKKEVARRFHKELEDVGLFTQFSNWDRYEEQRVPFVDEASDNKILKKKEEEQELVGKHLAARIVSTYGTHYVSQVSMGGQVRFLIKTDVCTLDTAVTSALKVQAEGTGVYNGVKGSVDAGVGTTSNQTTSVSSERTTCNAERLGGEDTTCSSASCASFKCDRPKWSESLKNHKKLVPIAFQLKELNLQLMEELFSNLGKAHIAYLKDSQGLTENQENLLKDNWYRAGYWTGIAIPNQIEEHVRVWVGGQQAEEADACATSGIASMSHVMPAMHAVVWVLCLLFA